jgi:hypothetical protein
MTTPTPVGPMDIGRINASLAQPNTSLQRIAHAVEALAKAEDPNFRTFSDQQRAVAQSTRKL